jgi:inorganic pyrophosphatase
MADPSTIPNHLDPEKKVCRAVIETPRGSRIKFKYEPASGMFEIAKFLPKGFVFPFEFGFVPATAGDDGDPTDVLVLMDEPAHVGCLLQVRLIGVIELTQTEDGKDTFDPRLVGIPLQSTDYAGVKTLDDLNDELRQQITEYLELYNKNSSSDRADKVTGLAAPERAIEIIRKDSKRFEESAAAAKQ